MTKGQLVRKRKAKTNKVMQRIIKDDKAVLDILKAIESELKIPYELLKVKINSHREIIDAKHLARYFVKKYTDYSLVYIGILFNCAHSTAINSIKVVKTLKGVDKDFLHKYNLIDESLKKYKKNKEKDSLNLTNRQITDISKMVAVIVLASEDMDIVPPKKMLSNLKTRIKKDINLGLIKKSVKKYDELLK